MPAIISAAVEGVVDEAVAKRLIALAGGELGTIYGRNGKSQLLQRLRGYNNAAKRVPWFILVDLDSDADCAPRFRNTWLPDPAPKLCFRVAVSEVEALLLADSHSLSRFLGISTSRVPGDPESLRDPKATLVNLAQRSRKRSIRDDIVPREASGRSIGPAYTSQLVDFVSNHWRPEIAAVRSDSLHRALKCLRRIVAGASE